ncbi:MAG: inosine/xanthosine triphosphatase, partial [Bacillota bacterium]
GVSVQPVNEDTFIGAKNRALYLFELNKQTNLGADYFVGIEGGIIKLFERWFALGAMCIMDKNGNTGFGTSPHFELPQNIIDQLLSGKELGLVMDEIMQQKNTKQKMGAISFFTKGVLDRKELYVQGLTVALIPFLQKEMFF